MVVLRSSSDTRSWVPAPEQIHQPAALNDSTPPTAKPFSPTAVAGIFSPAQVHAVALLPHSSTIFWSKHPQRPVCKDRPSGIYKNSQRLICSRIKIEQIS